MEDMSQELVEILVPKRHLSRIYGFIGSLNGVSEPSRDPVSLHEDEDEKVWDEELIIKQFNESPDSMQKFQKYLAAHPGQEFSTPEMATALGVAGGWNSIAGVLGAYGRRVRNRYKMKSFAFQSRWDYSTGKARHMMTPEVARIIESL